jgi:hypothetical protein
MSLRKKAGYGSECVLSVIYLLGAFGVEQEEKSFYSRLRDCSG